MNERVFVYGTLRNGGAQAWRMAGAKRMGSGAVRGLLYRVDWYPAVVLEGEGDVVGEVYEVDAMTLAALDAYEGDEYRRVRVMVSGDAAGEAWIWEWNGPMEGLSVIDSGDWLGA